MNNTKTIDLGGLAPADVIIKGIPCSTGTCEIVITGAPPLKMVINSRVDMGGLFSKEYKEFIYEILAIKTDRGVLDDAFDHLTTAHFMKIDEQVANVLAAAQRPDPETVKKK